MRIVFFLVVLFLTEVALSQSTFTVTNGSMGTSSSLDVILDQAVTSAQNGNNVTVYFDVSTGLIDISEPLPTIDNSQGSILLIPDPNATVPQGLRGVFPGNWGNFPGVGLNISNATDVTIQGLYFEDFDDGVVNDPPDVINIYHSDNIIINGVNEFRNNSWCIFAAQSDITVSDNFFENNIAPIQWSDNFNYPIPEIPNSEVHLTSNDITSCNRAIRVDFSQDLSLPISVDNNTIDNCGKGITVVNLLAYNQNNSLDVILNGITNCTQAAVTLVGPRPQWEVNKNPIANCTWGFVISDGFNEGNNDFTMTFAKANSLGINIKNDLNQIDACEYSFMFTSANQNYLLGYTADGQVLVTNYASTVIRENVLETSLLVTAQEYSPIKLDNNGNGEIDAFSLNYAYLYQPELLVNYTVTGTNPDNGDFVMEFFEANAQGDLITYIGNQTISGDGTYTALFSNANFTTGDRIGATITSMGDVGGTRLGTSEAKYIQPGPFPCDTCNGFMPIGGRDYWISAWVKVGSPQVKTYNNGSNGPSLELSFFGSGNQPIQFYPTGEIIDGWQRIVGKFTIPSGSLDLNLTLNADLTYNTYFDDIRIHPFNASMKSYVYDGETFWLTSELDDNNYATFYEYDEEGGLIRIKKETSRGIVTIQETRSNTVKE